MTQEKNRLEFMEQLLTCGTNIYMWRYGIDGHLISTNAAHLVLDIIFDHSGNKQYMIEQTDKYTAPLILGGQMGLMWCAVFEQRDGRPFSVYVLGPVFNSEISSATIEQSVSQYNLNLAWRQEFISLLKNLPVLSSVLFFQYALMMHYCITGVKLNRSDLHFRDWVDPGVKNKEQMPKRDRMRIYLTERALLNMIREGDLDYQKVMSNANLLSGGVKTGDKHPLLQAIVSCTSFTSLCVREAIEAGLSPDTAYSVGDQYIQSMVECATITELRSINHAMYEDFIMRVHKHRTNPKVSMQIRRCRDYIESHAEQPLTLEILSKFVGYSEYHLSRKFKEEMGVSIRDYIKYAKMERAKQLLITTNNSVAKIASDLQFCSSSHFSDVFQRVIGKKPQEYRREHTLLPFNSRAKKWKPIAKQSVESD